MKKYILICVAFLVICAIVSCVDDADFNSIASARPELPATPYDYESSNLPVDVVIQDNTPSYNPITNDGATLGRVLFYDTKLSRNNKVSCASCHKQNLAFSDDVAFSDGFEGVKTRRNSLPIMNSQFSTSLVLGFLLKKGRRASISPHSKPH